MAKKTKILTPRITYLAFIECEIRGDWTSEEEERIDLNGQEFPEGRHSYMSLDRSVELEVLERKFLSERPYKFGHGMKGKDGMSMCQEIMIAKIYVRNMIHI